MGKYAYCLSIRSKLGPMRDMRILSNVQSHTSLPPSGMGGHSWTAYSVKGVYTDQPELVCNSDVAVVVPQVPLVKLFIMHSLSIRSKLYPPCDIRIPNILTSHEPTPFWCGGSLLDYPIHVEVGATDTVGTPI